MKKTSIKNERGQATNQRGQATMEAVLILVVIVLIAAKISNVAKSHGFVRQLVEGTWSPVRGMIEDGVWVKATDSKPLHPNFRDRHQSRQGETT